MDDREEALHGGLVDGRVVKVGDTVRRPAGGWTETIHALLAHLQTKRFPSPRPIGIDGAGREVVSFIPGVCSNHPWPPALLATSGARQVGLMLRAYHDAVADFRPLEPAIWRHGAHALEASQIVTHGDFGPHNLIWAGDRLTGVIDFELARPGKPIEDAVFAVLRVAHLRPDEMASAVGFDGPPNRRARLEAFADGYGVSPDVLLADSILVQAAELDRMLRLGGSGMEPWATFLSKGLAAQVQLEMTWLENNLAILT